MRTEEVGHSHKYRECAFRRSHMNLDLCYGIGHHGSQQPKPSGRRASSHKEESVSKFVDSRQLTTSLTFVLRKQNFPTVKAQV